MSLPTVVKSYQYNVNTGFAASGVVQTDGRNVLLFLKNALIGFATLPWTVRYSCSSTVAGTAGDGVDRWGSTGTNLVWGVAGSAHSWMVLRQTGTGANTELLIALDASSVSGVSFIVSPSAGFTGGTTTANPTATDSYTLMSGGSNIFFPAASIATRVHVLQSTDGASTKCIITTSTTNTGVQFALLLEQLTNLVSGWTNIPLVGYAFGVGNSTTKNALHSANFNNQNWLARPVSTNISGIATCEGTTSNTLPAAAANQFANELDGNWLMLPVGFVGAGAGFRGRHGTIIDVWQGSEGLSYGSTYPNDTSYQFAQFGSLIVPWNGTQPQL